MSGESTGARRVQRAVAKVVLVAAFFCFAFLFGYPLSTMVARPSLIANWSNPLSGLPLPVWVVATITMYYVLIAAFAKVGRRNQR